MNKDKKTVLPLGELYEKEVVPTLRKELGRENIFSLPRITHVVVHSGVGKHGKESGFIEDVDKGLELVTGQKPASRIARKSVAGFKLRQGQRAGSIVTLRGKRMEDFIQRLIHVVLPRVRDFRGVSMRNIDSSGNLSLGIREAHVFPEVNPQDIERIFGLQITVVTTAKNQDEAKLLFKELGFPLTEDQNS